MDMAHFFLFIFVISYIVQAESSSTVIRAKALIYKAIPKDVPSENIGMIEFFQNGTETKIIGYVSINAGLHGFHIHEKGDMSDGCNAAGSHFNPHHLLHGGPTDTIRHVGDLGNIEGNKSGITNISITDSLVSLEGMHTVIGRSVVIHENADDFGKGDTDASSKTGNAGGRIACGIIGIL